MPRGLLRVEDISARDECVKAAYRCSCLGLTFLMIWLLQLYITPLIYLRKFYIPLLNNTINPLQNTTIYFQLELLNFNGISSVYYDPINVTFFDGPNSSHFVANFTIPKFHQGTGSPYDLVIKDGQVDAPGLDREVVFREVATNRWAVFRVDVATYVRYNPLFWKSKRYSIDLGANFKVNDQGMIFNNEKTLLKSDAAKIRYSFGQMGFLALNFVALIVLNM